jgi:uncharacterized repeat protein (TIGR01451 family)
MRSSFFATRPVAAVSGFVLCVFAAAVSAATLAPVSRTAAALANDAGNARSDATTYAISGDGCRSVFTSAATNLVAGQVDINGASDIFLHDCVGDTVTLISHKAGEPLTTSNSSSTGAVISRDGRYIAFLSVATDMIVDLVKEHSEYDLYLYDTSDASLRLINDAPANPGRTSDFGAGAPVFSADGTIMIFGSASTDLLENVGDENSGADVFSYDLATGVKSLITRRVGGGLCLFSACTANEGSGAATVSADGNYVAFTSGATNLFAGQADAPGTSDVFVWSRASNSTALVSRVGISPLAAAGARSENASISSDGLWVVYTSQAANIVSGQSDGNLDSDVFLYSRSTGFNTLVSHLPGTPLLTDVNAYSGNPSINADGSRIAFTSVSQIMVAGQNDPASLSDDLFVFERATGSNSLISHAAGSAVNTAAGSTVFSRFTDDGAQLIFSSRASNLVAGQADINSYGDSLMGDDIYRHSFAGGTTLLLSHVPAQAAQAGRFMSFIPSVDASGANVVFVSDGDDLSGAIDNNDERDIYRWTQASGAVTLITARDPASDPVGMIGATEAVTSADGRYVAFMSEARNVYPGLIDNDTDNTSIERDDDLFLLDRDTGDYVLISRSAAGIDVTGDNDSRRPRISGDGRYVVFEGASVQMVAGQNDGNGAYDIFLFDRTDRSVKLISHAAGAPTQTGNGSSNSAEISRDGSYIVFSSTASNLIAGGTDANGASDVFGYDIGSDTLRLVSHSSAGETIAGNGDARSAGLSSDGAWIAFQSSATDHILGQDLNGGNDVYLFNRGTGANRLVSRQSGNPSRAGSQASRLPAISGDGRFVAYQSQATDLLPGFFSDGNGGDDVYLFDRDAFFAPNVLVSRQAGEDSVSGDGSSTEISLSDDGARVAFLSASTNLVAGQLDSPLSDDLFLFHTDSATVTLISQSAFSTGVAVGAERAMISGDGSSILFDSRSFEIAEGLTSAENESKTWLHLVDAATSVLLSRSVLGPGTPPVNYSQLGDISPDGSVSLFLTPSPDIVTFDGNRAFVGQFGMDAFVFERALGIPVVVGPGDQAVLEDQSTGPLAFSISDPDGDASQLLVTARSSDGVIIPANTIVIGGSGANRTVEVIPGAEQSGEAIVTLRATDADGNVGAATFTVTIGILNDIPQLFLPGPTILLEGQSSPLLDFTVDDPDHDESELLFAVSSSDPALVPTGGIALAGSGSNRRVRVTPTSDAFGEVIITVSAEDPDGGIGQATFPVSITNINDAPVFTAGAAVVSDEDVDTLLAGWATAIDAGPFEAAQALAFEVVGNTNPALFESGPAIAANGTLSYSPAENASGPATITLRLRDDGGIANGGEDTSATQQFSITIEAVNDDPVVVGPATFAVDEDGVATYEFTVADAEDGAGPLIVSAATSNPAVIPLANLIGGGSGTNRTLSITPADDAHGTVNVQLTVADTDGGETVHTVLVTVEQIDESVDVSTTLGNGLSYIDIGADVSWTAVIANDGDDTAYAVRVTDNAPVGLTDVLWSCEGAACPVAAGNGAIDLLVTLPPGSQVELTIAGVVTAAAAPLISYAIDAEVDADSVDTDPADNLAIDTDSVGLRVFADGFE